MRKFLLVVLVVCTALLLFVQCGKKTDAAIETESKSVDADTAEYFISFSIGEVEYKWTVLPVVQITEQNNQYKFFTDTRKDPATADENHIIFTATGVSDSGWANRAFEVSLWLGKDMYTAQDQRLALSDEGEVFKATFDGLELSNDKGETKTLGNGVMNFQRAIIIY